MNTILRRIRRLEMSRLVAPRLVAVVGVLALTLAACGGADTGGAGDDGTGTETGTEAAAMPGEGVEVTEGRATWTTGYMQSHIYNLLLEELGYTVSAPSDNELGAAQFYPAMARGEVDFWANGWFPLHTPILEDTELPGGGVVADQVTAVGFQVEAGALQGYLVDKKTADELDITSMSDLSREEVREAFDTDGNDKANITGCDNGWGCNETINQHLDNLDWGEHAEQVVGTYSALMSDVVARIERGEPALFYTWTPNWTVDVLTPGEDVVWLESPALPEHEGSTEVDGLEGCAAEQPCQLGWVANDIRVVANNDFLAENPAAEALFENVEIPLKDIAAQNAEMNAADDYSESDIEQDAREWIEDNREQVDEWLAEARAAA